MDCNWYIIFIYAKSKSFVGADKQYKTMGVTDFELLDCIVALVSAISDVDEKKYYFTSGKVTRLGHWNG